MLLLDRYRKTKIMLNSVGRDIMCDSIKVFLYPTSEYACHWISEIYEVLNEVPMRMVRHRFPKSVYIYNHLLKHNLKYARSYYDSIVECYGETEVSYSSAESAMIDYIVWISIELGCKGRVDAIEVAAYWKNAVEQYWGDLSEMYRQQMEEQMSKDDDDDGPHGRYIIEFD